MTDTYRAAVLNLYAGRTAYDTEPGTRHPRVAQQLVAESELMPGDSVLDVATGTGLVAFEAATRVGDQGNVVALDLSETMLNQARVKGGAVRNIDFRTMDAMTAAFPPNSFDRIFCCEALVLLEDPISLLECWRPLLNTNGSLSFTCTHADSYFGIELKRAVESVLGPGCPTQMHEPLGSPEKIAAALRLASFGEPRIASEESGRYRPLDQVRCTRGFVSLMFKGAEMVTSLPDEQFAEVCRQFHGNLSAHATTQGVWEGTGLYFVYAFLAGEVR